MDDFDWKFYINHYKDLRESGVNSRERALKHWLNFGKNENRISNSKKLEEIRLKKIKKKRKNMFLSLPDKTFKYLIFLLKESCFLYYQYLIEKQYKYIRKINKNNNFKIVYFVDLDIFINKMSRVRFWPIIELVKKKNVETIFFGPGWPKYNKNISIQQNILNLNINFNFVIWYKPLSVNFDKNIKFKFPTCIRYNEMWDKEWTVKEINSTYSDLIICHHLNDYDIYKKLMPNKRFKYLAHQANFDVFNNKNNVRNIDILLSGRNKIKHYPLKCKLFSIIKKYKNTLLKKYNIYEHVHPGYNNNLSYTDINQKKYSELLNKSKIAVSCTSKYNYRLGKYVEIPMCGTVILGDIPYEDKGNFKKFVIEVNLEMDEKIIIQKIIDALENKDELQKKAELGYKWSLKYTSRNYADNLLYLMQNFDSSTNKEKHQKNISDKKKSKIFIISDEIKENHPEFKNQKWICDILKQQFLSYFPDITTTNAKEAEIIWYLASWNRRYIPSEFTVNSWYEFLKKKKVIFSVHHIDIDKYIKDEKNEFKNNFDFMKKYGNKIHAICQKTYNFLEKCFESEKLVKEYLWIEGKDFFYIENKLKLREKYHFSQNAFLVGSFQKDTEGNSDCKNPIPKLSKGPDVFINIIENMLITNPNIEVILTGLRREYIIQQLKKRNIKYHYFNMITLKELNELYNCLDLYLVSSRYEGGPRSIFEAGITKTPLISSDVGIASEFMPKESIYSVSNFLSYKNAKPNVEQLYRSISRLKIDKQIEKIKDMLCN